MLYEVITTEKLDRFPDGFFQGHDLLPGHRLPAEGENPAHQIPGPFRTDQDLIQVFLDLSGKVV